MGCARSSPGIGGGILAAALLLLAAALWAPAPQAGLAQATTPAQPTGLTATAGGQQATLNWDDPSDSSITGYEYLLYTEVAKLTASDGADDGYFGYSVAVDRDTEVVGAYGDDGDKGAVYVLTRQSGAWNEVAKLTASNGANDDRFGDSVAVSGDTVVVGAFLHNGSKGAAYVFTKPNSGWVTATETAKLTATNSISGDYFGRSVAVDGDTVVVGASDYDDFIGAAYVFTEPAGGWVDATQTAKLTPSSRSSLDHFGISVAVDGDTVAVGSDDDTAYVFTKPSGGWADTSDTAKLTASDRATGDYFGESVALNGNTVVVGAYRNDGDEGSAYLFAKPSAGWADPTETVKLTALDRDSNDPFGISVAVDGNTVVVGAYKEDEEGSDAGSAYVYEVSDWIGIPNSEAGGTNAAFHTVTGLTNDEEYKFRIRATNSIGAGPASASVTVTPTNTAPTAIDDTGTTAVDTAVDVDVVANDIDPDFGAALSVTAVAAPSNGTAMITPGSTTSVTYTPDAGFAGIDSFEYTLSDGTATDTGTVNVTVGPPAKPTGFAATAGNGRATLEWDDPFDGSITGYEYLKAEVSKLTASDGAASDDFGYSVSVDGDTAVMGAYGDDNDKGSAYVFTRQSGAWGQVAKLTASDRQSNDLFGVSVAVDGDTVVVGAYLDDDNGRNSGSADIFTKPSGGWADATETAKLTASQGNGGDRFGFRVALDGDTVVVGARYDDDDASDSGSAYVFTKPNTGWTNATETAHLTASDAAFENHFGSSVAADEDTVVVGVWWDSAGALQSGSAYVFTKPIGGWTTATENAKLTASDGAAEDWFGNSVAVEGDTVVVGAFWDDNAKTNSGSAYVFTKPDSGWATATETAKLTASDAKKGDFLGRSVAVQEDSVVVGASSGDGKVKDSGSVYLFIKPETDWIDATETAKMQAPDGAAYDSFGTSVELDGDTVVVSAHVDDDNGRDSGSVYVFAASDWTGIPDWTAIPDSAAGGTNATSYTVSALTNNAGYTFRTRATNSVGTSPASGVVAVTPTNASPTAVDDDATTDENTAVDIHVVTNDTDADGDPLSVTSVTTPDNGTAAITVNSTTTVTYTPNTGFTGTDSFDYTVSDGIDTDTGTVTVTVTGS